MSKIYAALLALVLCAVPSLLYWNSLHKIETRDKDIATLQSTVDAQKASLQREVDWSASRENVIKSLLVIGEDIKKVQDQIKANDKASQAALKELIKNDKEVRDYMAQPVPAALGLQYQRPATTDPTQYRSGRSVHSDAMPVPRSGSTSE